jgi:hypothetical protein
MTTQNIHGCPLSNYAFQRPILQNWFGIMFEIVYTMDQAQLYAIPL